MTATGSLLLEAELTFSHSASQETIWELTLKTNLRFFSFLAISCFSPRSESSSSLLLVRIYYNFLSGFSVPPSHSHCH